MENKDNKPTNLRKSRKDKLPDSLNYPSEDIYNKDIGRGHQSC
jgi:hypothetical protein